MIICDINKCFGCAVCENICTANACTLKTDNEGFLSPVIDDSKCSKCNLCKSKCPSLFQTTSYPIIGSYAYYTNNLELRTSSSSGGIFSDIATYIINEKKGLVVGAAYSNKEDNSHYVKHIIIDNVCDLYKIRGSKYVQSDIRDALKSVKKFIKSGKVVLFSGTPCQVAAVKSFIGNNDNLYTVDLFCHGVPSPKVFYKYLEEMKTTKTTIINFKDKSLGWNDSCITFDTIQSKYKVRHSQDTFYLGFVDNLYLRKSCYTCKYNQLNNRPGDISIGDFWEIESFFPELNDDKGINAVITNTIKGESILTNIKSSAGLCKPVNINTIIPGNSILTTTVKQHPHRKKFFDDFNSTNNFIISARKHLNIGNNVLLLNHSFSHNNYGAMMVAYSMERIVEKLGFNPTTLLFRNQNHTKIFDSFKKEFLHTTSEIDQDDYRSLVKLNKHYDTFITGSDQVWRNWSYNNTLYRWFVDFANDSKNIFSYAASFGFNYFEEKGVSMKKIQSLLKTFSGISVREKSGIEICKKCFNAEAKLVIDPTQLLEAEDYDKIIEIEKAKPPIQEPYLAYMIFPEDENATENTYNFIQNLASELNLKAIPLLSKEDDKQKTIGEWLATIKYASFIVTESFHGTMFSLIYKVPMLILALDETERNRLPVFFEKIDYLNDRILYTLDYQAAVEIAKKEIDWTELYRRRRIFQNESLDFLRTSLSKQILSNGRKHIWSLNNFLAYFRKILLKLLPKPIKKILKTIKMYLFKK